MPHLILEYSANVADHVDCAKVFHSLHDALMEFETFPRFDLKSRAVRHTDYCVGDGAPQNAFVHLTLALLSGRDISVRQRISEACLKVLCHLFVPPMPPLDGPDVQVTVELREMERAAYTKFRRDNPTEV